MINTQSRIDFLNLGDRVGRGKSFVFYSCMIFAIFNLVAALILILIPMNDPQIQNNNSMIFARRAWSKQQDLQKMLLESQIILHINDPNLKFKDSQKQMNKKLQQLSFFSHLNTIQSSDYYGSNQIGHQWNYSTKLEDVQFSFFLNEISEATQFVNAGSETEIFSLKTLKQTKFDVKDMIAQNMCQDEISCKQSCQKNKNEFKSIDGQQFCEGIYNIANICAVMDFNEKKIIRGCYKDGLFEKYTLIQAEKSEKKKIIHLNQKFTESLEIKFEIYDKLDPHVKALEISQTYQPYEQTISEYQKASKYFFLLGGIISISILFIYTMISSSDKKEEEIMKKNDIINLTQISEFN